MRNRFKSLVEEGEHLYIPFHVLHTFELLPLFNPLGGSPLTPCGVQ